MSLLGICIIIIISLIIIAIIIKKRPFNHMNGGDISTNDKALILEKHVPELLICVFNKIHSSQLSANGDVRINNAVKNEYINYVYDETKLNIEKAYCQYAKFDYVITISDIDYENNGDILYIICNHTLSNAKDIVVTLDMGNFGPLNYYKPVIATVTYNYDDHNYATYRIGIHAGLVNDKVVIENVKFLQ